MFKITGDKNPETKKSKLSIWLTSLLLRKKKQDETSDHVNPEGSQNVKTVGRYEIIKKIGHGNMGIVYKGRDPYIERDVSIKLSKPSAEISDEKADKYRTRFFIEAQSAGRLMHPNIVAIYDAGMYEDSCYIAMEYIDGPTLKEFCNPENRISPEEVSEIIVSACSGLDYAHQRGVIHRDIKPSNIMLNSRGEVKITDFGIAKIKNDHTVSKEIIGSPSYMSPEQIREEPVDNVSDVFSLGCVLYELLTCSQAFPGENHFSIMYKITNVDPPPVCEAAPDVPKILSDITGKALAKKKDERYQSCMDFAYDLRIAVRGLREGGPRRETVDDIIDYIHNIQFFSGFTKSHVKQILSAANIIKISKSKIIMSEGEVDDSFYIILSGRAVVRKNNNDIAFISRGECFGEMAYLSGESRVASVIADSDCILLKISSMLLDKSSSEIQLLFLKRFAMTLLRRLSSSLDKEKQS